EKRWDELFYNANFYVSSLPNYKEKSPFLVFNAIPSRSRYKFMLDEAFFTISGFIKGPVCRGSVAVNVINDHFWVFFANPDKTSGNSVDQFIFGQANNLRLPAEASSQTFSIANWIGYSQGQIRYINAKSDYINAQMDLESGLLIDLVWAGNENAALTVFRHIDNASVLKGSLGTQPKTAWLIDYPILERIHYLLVAGFDVFGNIGHQVKTRLYMDFLRIEAEMNIVSLLPNESRKEVMNSWYLDASSDLDTYLNDSNLLHSRPSGIDYETPYYKDELMAKLKQHVYQQDKTKNSALKYAIPPQDKVLKRLSSLDNSVVRELPEVSFIIIEADDKPDRIYTLLRHNAHKNISSLLNETANRLPKLDTAGLFKGLIGDYPGIIFRVHERDMVLFVNQFARAKNSKLFVGLLEHFSLRRTNPDFWKVSDNLHQLHYQSDPIAYGLLDYNRIENR
ncbi:MAG: fatty acid cis/trans isomerase, partial [Psychromonas sp.]